MVRTAPAKYTTSDAQAINLGIYGADLSYATIFEENATSLEYLAAIKSLSAELGVDDVLKRRVMDEVKPTATTATCSSTSYRIRFMS